MFANDSFNLSSPVKLVRIPATFQCSNLATTTTISLLVGAAGRGGVGGRTLQINVSSARKNFESCAHRNSDSRYSFRSTENVDHVESLSGS